LARDRDPVVAEWGAKVVRAIEGLGERGSLDYYMPFGI